MSGWLLSEFKIWGVTKIINSLWFFEVDVFLKNCPSIGTSPNIGNFVIVSFTILSKTPVKIKVFPSLTLIVPVSSLLVFNRSIVAQPSISLCSDFDDIAGDSVKVT